METSRYLMPRFAYVRETLRSVDIVPRTPLQWARWNFSAGAPGACCSTMDDSRNEYRRFHQRRHRALVELLECHAPPPGSRWLDIGGGADVLNLHETVKNRFGGTCCVVDQGADVALGRAGGLDAQACDVDTEALPYPDGYFAAVLFLSVIEHLYNPRHALDEIARVLRPGGVLIIEAPNAVALGRRLDAVLGKNPFARFNEYNAAPIRAPMFHCAVFYTAEEIERLLAASFEILTRRHAMHNPPAGPIKRALREIVFRMRPALGDCFFVVAKRMAPVAD